MASDARGFLFQRGGDPDDEEITSALAREDLSWGRALKFVGKRLWNHPWLVSASLFLGLLLAVTEFLSLSLIMPFIANLSGESAAVVNDSKLAFLVPVLDDYDTVTQIRIIAVGLLAIQVVKALLGYVAGRVASYQKVLLDRDLRTEIFGQIVALEMSYVNKEKTANLYTILHSYPKSVASVGGKLVGVVPRAGTFIAYVVALFILSWQLTLLALGLAIFTNWVVGFTQRVVRRYSRRINVHMVRLKHLSLEMLNGMKLVHLYGRESYAEDRFRKQLRSYQDTRYRRSSLEAAITPLYGTLMTLMFAAVLVGGTILLTRTAEAWVALLTMFMVVMFRLMVPTAVYARTRTKIASDIPALEQIMDFLERDDKPYLLDGDRPFTALEEGLRFEDVHFAYEEASPVIQGVSFEVPRGTTVALVGGSGAGKSTMVDLVARLYDPQRGRILVDGEDLRSFQVTTWRSRLAVVSQSTFLFNDSVRENIRFGRLDATDEEVEEAARLANAHPFISELPEGYDTPLGDRGVRLSGGQAQRLAIARAVLADPEVLILDEATSALDTETERRVQEALDRVARDRTVIAIAHRLSTVRNADQILVLEQGRIVERGTHADLLARRGRYWEYVQMQDLTVEGASLAPAPTPTPALQAPDDLAVVLTPGRRTARLENGNDASRELPIRVAAGNATVSPDRDQVVLRRGRDDAEVHLDGCVHDRVPLFSDRPAENGTPQRRIRVRVDRVETSMD